MVSITAMIADSLSALVAAIAQSAPEAKERIEQFLSKQADTKVRAPK